MLKLFSLNQSLQWPYREVFATAIYDFEPKGNNQLQLKTGCQVLVIGKDGDSKGWWRGKIGDVVSFFKHSVNFSRYFNIPSKFLFILKGRLLPQRVRSGTSAH